MSSERNSHSETLRKYFVAQLLSGKVKEFQENLERQIFQQFNIKPLHWRIPPHLTLKAPFDWPEEKEEVVKQALKEKAEKSTIIPIELSGFGHFGRRTIFIKAKYPPELKMSIKKMRNRLRREEIEITKSDRKLNLHSSVARFLELDQFYQIWHFVRQFKIKEVIEYNHFTLLKHDGKKWQLSEQFFFNH
jgi:2'-5' RNA ligase